MTLNFSACRTGFACLLLLLLVGCSGSVKQDTATRPITPERAAHPNPEVEAQFVRLDAAGILTQQQRHLESLDLVLSLQPQSLPVEYHWQALNLGAINSLALDDGWTALRLIETFSQRLPHIDRTQQFVLSGYRADALLLTGFYSSALRHRHHQALLAQDDKSRADVYERLWNNLNQVSSDELRHLQQTERQPLLRGWIELALVRQTAITNPEQISNQLQAWATRWPQHPARQQYTPEEIDLLVKLSEDRIQHLAVFLPESGPLAEAAYVIRDALLAKHLSTVQKGQHAPRISFYDSQANSLDELYSRAKSQGVEVVIGPLAKAQVDLLERRRSLPLPTLALNYGNDEDFQNKDMFQFGLSAENEAAQVALKAWQSGFRRALVLTPENSWGSRVEASFIKNWKELGGEISHSRQYGASLSLDASLRQLLEVQLSQERHQRLTRLLGQRPHFAPRPREDSDFLFLHADPATARQIKPALSFLAASSLPVLATSAVYSGTVNPGLDRDMNGIAFCDIPWYLESGDPLQQEVRQTWPENITRYGRLYAMGADAYLLAQRLPLLEVLPQSRIDGATGRLSQQGRRIERELQWAQFNSGKPQPLAANAFEQQPQLVDQILPD
ncbi:MAG: penicillin-binding protein activator [Marinospirillum sp.]|uniref:penicillin-binding protein activator n=1 Tax=Marinospirillum sp. TaxID=2183934 RepID=UPI0019DC8955|nr:penicillin-binding protein activator [Marinospirillum sp.]MBE0505359.1 penicillin-binding protein activator [Marinospirillum sp.]